MTGLLAGGVTHLIPGVALYSKFRYFISER